MGRRRRHSATVIIWTLAHYRVTTVWLHVEDDHTMLMKFIVEDGPQLFYCLLRNVLTMFLEILIRIRRGRDKKKKASPCHDWQREDLK